MHDNSHLRGAVIVLTSHYLDHPTAGQKRTTRNWGTPSA